MNHHEQVIKILTDHFKDNSFIGIEIGTAEALLSKSILLYLPNSKMYAIDPYKHDDTSPFEANRPQEWHDDRRKQAEIALAVYKERAILISDTSDNAVLLTPPQVDFVWIDGDHRDFQIEKDILNYYPKVRLNGIFGGHDIQIAESIIKKLLIEDLHFGEDLTWWIFKK